MRKKMWIPVFVIIALIIGCIVYRYLSEDKNDTIDSNNDIVNEYNDETEFSNKEIGIYSINYDNQECEPSFIVVPDGKAIDEKYIVDEVIANFNEEVSINKIEKIANSIIVVFGKNSAPACNVSPTMEALMLDCISYSLIDNIKNCQNVIFRIEDEAYQGVEITLEYDEPYISSDISEDEDE